MASEYPKVPEWQGAGGQASEDSQISENAPAADMVLGFRVGDWGFLLPISLHCEVIGAAPVNPIPKVEPWFSGLLNIRGNIAPVVDLRLLSGNSAKPSQKRYLLAIDKGEKTMVLWIDDYPQMMADLTTPLPSLPALPAELFACVRNAYAQQGQIWLKVQFEPLFKTLGIRQSHQQATS